MHAVEDPWGVTLNVLDTPAPCKRLCSHSAEGALLTTVKRNQHAASRLIIPLGLH